MYRIMCKSKIHMASITKKALRYKGSIGIDAGLLKAADMLPGERVQIVNVNNGERFETYIIEEKAGSGRICLYGPAARLGEERDNVIIISYALYDDRDARAVKPVVVKVDTKNHIAGG